MRRDTLLPRDKQRWPKWFYIEIIWDAVIICEEYLGACVVAVGLHWSPPCAPQPSNFQPEEGRRFDYFQLACSFSTRPGPQLRWQYGCQLAEKSRLVSAFCRGAIQCWAGWFDFHLMRWLLFSSAYSTRRWCFTFASDGRWLMRYSYLHYYLIFHDILRDSRLDAQYYSREKSPAIASATALFCRSLPRLHCHACYHIRDITECRFWPHFSQLPFYSTRCSLYALIWHSRACRQPFC